MKVELVEGIMADGSGTLTYEITLEGKGNVETHLDVENILRFIVRDGSKLITTITVKPKQAKENK